MSYMESITIRVDSALANEMEKAMHPYYATKTEFIREAIRDKLEDLKIKTEVKEHMDELMNDLRNGRIRRVDVRAKRK